MGVAHQRRQSSVAAAGLAAAVGQWRGGPGTRGASLRARRACRAGQRSAAAAAVLCVRMGRGHQAAKAQLPRRALTEGSRRKRRRAYRRAKARVWAAGRCSGCRIAPAKGARAPRDAEVRHSQAPQPEALPEELAQRACSAGAAAGGADVSAPPVVNISKLLTNFSLLN